MKEREHVVIYHAGCTDGLVAAWVVRQRAPNATFIPMIYGKPPPEFAGKHITIVDFSFHRDVLLDMAMHAAEVTVFDHHKTAKAELADLPFCTFDMERSGAGIAWDSIMHGQRPWIIDYVEDRDLWRFKLPHSKEINAYLQLLPKTFEAIDEVTKLSLEEVTARGYASQRAIDSYVEVMASLARPGSIADVAGMGVNAGPWAVSDLLDHLAQGNAFSFAWRQHADGQYCYSLRSRGELGVDVSDIAKTFGGGGHAQAAGFSSPYPVHNSF